MANSLFFLHGLLIHTMKWYSIHAMCKESTKEIIFPAEPVIAQYGGVGKLAEYLGYDYQRVHNWISRGIPALEVALRPDVFAAAKVGADKTAGVS
jgi:hypothetical protein